MSQASTQTKLRLWRKLIAGADTRKTRLHDEHGHRASLGALIRNMPRALSSGLLRITLDVRPARP